jgi:hypothetical protein
MLFMLLPQEITAYNAHRDIKKPIAEQSLSCFLTATGFQVYSLAKKEGGTGALQKNKTIKTKPAGP